MADIRPRDRLGFTLFLAASLHAALILGIGFSSDLNLERTPSIEVTLALTRDDTAPDDARYIAATSQLGSGDDNNAAEPTTTERSPFHDNRAHQVEQQQQPEQASTMDTATQAVVSTMQGDDPPPSELPRSDSLISQLQPKTYDTLLEEIASLEARIAAEEQARADAPRTHRLTSVSTKSAAEAAYLHTWREKVERVGNANFPNTGIFGALRLLVVLREDGTLADVRIIESSGHQSLDLAAERIVRLAAPYPPFPLEMRKKYDRLEIIRTWKFSRSGNSFGNQ
ncbi:MAG: TonB family protein [Pseudomonadales bacterium]